MSTSNRRDVSDLLARSVAGTVEPSFVAPDILESAAVIEEEAARSGSTS